jgi:hypothetical protein
MNAGASKVQIDGPDAWFNSNATGSLVVQRCISLENVKLREVNVYGTGLGSGNSEPQFIYGCCGEHGRLVLQG